MSIFDEVITRTKTDCAKWDATANEGKPADVIPMWVADMDFKAPQAVIDALQKRVEHGVYGYTFISDEYRQIVVDWMQRRHQWTIDKDWIVPTPGVVTALKIAVNAYTKEGDAIIIQKPVYYPFDFSIEQNGRTKIENPVLFNGQSFSIDFEDFEQKIIEHNVKMYILCNPYNPIGKVWTKEELKKIGDICKKHGVIVVSDEIHHDFVFAPNVHTPFFEVNPSYKDFSIICTAPSKTFNLAGLHASNIIIANEQLKQTFIDCKSKMGISDPNIFGLEACKAAYSECDAWCDELVAYVKANFDYMDTYFKEHMPKLKLIQPQGLYLGWVDFRELGLNHEELEKFMLEKAKLWLDEGYIFGMQGAGFERFNVATPRSILKKALDGLYLALEKEGML